MSSESHVRRSRVKGDKALQRLHDSPVRAEKLSLYTLEQAQVPRRSQQLTVHGSRRTSVQRPSRYLSCNHSWAIQSTIARGKETQRWGATRVDDEGRPLQAPSLQKKSVTACKIAGYCILLRGWRIRVDAPCTPAGSAPCVVQRPARAYGPRWEPKQFDSRDPLTAHGHARRTVTRKQARARAYMIRWRVDKLDRRVCAHLDLAHLFRWDAIISLEFIGLFVAAGVSILKLRFPN